MAVIHLLNGDSTLHIFKETAIPGQVFVWREVLCEGPIYAGIDHPHFWDNRMKHMLPLLGATQKDYEQKCVQEFKAFQKSIPGASEIVLWFEYDLFCQLNLMAILHFLGRKNAKVSLVCVGNEFDDHQLYGLGQLSPDYYEILYRDRNLLSSNDLDYAITFWNAYVSDNPEELLGLLKSIPESYAYLGDAMRAHLLRFPNHRNGLSELEESVVQLIESGGHTKFSIVGTLLNRPYLYGFGDLQLFNLLKRLSLLFHTTPSNNLALTKLGELVLKGKENFNRHADEQLFGGLSTKKYYWDEVKRQLVANTISN